MVGIPCHPVGKTLMPYIKLYNYFRGLPCRSNVYDNVLSFIIIGLIRQITFNDLMDMYELEDVTDVMGNLTGELNFHL